ncbi:uncharacterized protein LOC135834709 isoform X2 [Planococcus citri]|uniref:uncharacterized protein LOC135834709 isoform X2 n=1 Tax=Planococcus citri TaxID=170843 RepID=UPI0031F8667E
MDDHNEDEENQPNVLGDEATYSDSDDDMEVNRSDDKNTVDKLDSELVDSDVNVEATELTCSDDADLSDESDLIGDLTSDAESNVDQHEINDSVVDSEEETFALEVKDAKDDSSDEKDEVDEAEKDEVDEAEKDEVDEADQDEVDEADRENLTKNAPDADDADGNDAEDDINGDDYQNSDDEEKSTNNASSENVTGEITPSNDVEDHENKSVTSADESEAIDTKASDTKTLANGELSSTSQNEEHDARAKNVRRLPTLSKYESDAEEDTGERADGSTQPEAAEPANGFNFIGFDPDITERTLQIFYILQQNYQDLLSQLENASPKYEDDLAMEVDTEQSSQLADTVPEPAMCIDSDMASGDVSLDNQTEEQIAANKRVKKKRKFFDDFDNNELDPPKRLKEQLDKPPNVDVSMGENKENFINSEKLPEEKELTEVAPASPVSVVSSTPNPPSRPKSKPKVDISNPLFKEPFKYGWRREVVYRYISEDGQKKSADVSYFTPQGKKLRSTKQISDSLPKDGTLSIRNFTFSKELVFSNRECDLERTRFTKKMEAELLENESANVSGDLMLNRRLGIDPASTHTPVTSASASMPDAGDDLSKNPTTAAVFPATLTPAPSSSKKKDPQKSKSNAKTPGSDAVSKSKSSSKKGNKNMADPDAEESTNNMTPKLMMPKILLRAPNMANSNTASSKVTSGGKPSSMKIKIGGPPSKQSGQKSVKKPPSSSKSSKGSKSQKRTDKSIAPDLVSGSISADHSSHANINGISPNDLSAYHAIGSRAPIEYHSSFNLSNISRIYDPLLMSLKYLTVRDLLRISMTSKFLNRIASEPCLWKTVRLKNSQVHDWKGFAKSLQKYGTKRLDMRKMLCSAVPEDLSKMWQEFLQVIPTITSLEHIDFSRTPMHVIDAVAATCPNLAVFNAMYLKNGSLTFDNFTRLEHLAELRLKGAGGIELIRNDSLLQFVNKDNLREICLTCIKNIDIDLLKMISEASNLVTLELGDCSDLPPSFGTEIGKLQKLEKLRLEKVDNLAPDYELLTILNGMETLKSLELINVEVKDGFDEVMARCNNIENFLIIPLYISQSATTNQLILDGIKGLSDTLKCFVWGLTTELLKVTDLFMDQWQLKSGGGSNNTGSNKKSAGSIPVRKSVDKPSPDGDVPPTHVDILPIPKLERILGTHLPKSRIKVIKVPFQMTWRQSLSDCLK